MTGRRRSVLVTLVATVLLLGTITDVRANGSSDGTATSNAASRWVERVLTAVRTSSPASAAHASTPGAARTYAMTTGAMYDAVNGIDVAEGRSSRTAAIIPSYAGAPSGADRQAAVSAAAHIVLQSLFGSGFDTALAGELAASGSDPELERGRAWGESVGRQVLALRANDGSQLAESKSGGAGAGVFPRPFTGTQFRHMTPFGVASVARHASGGPPPLTSEEYAEAFNEVRSLGGADGNAERTAIARHWLAENGTVRETGLWLKAALTIARDQNTLASLSDSVRLFALLGMGIADAVIVSWNDKYDWHYWRPADAIRLASSDGNPLTEEDPSWMPRGGGFGGTPEHTSGTSTFAGAAAAILTSFYCSDLIPFAFAGEQPDATPRSYRGFAEAAREAGRSRIYGGIHFQFSNDAGREAGRSIGLEIVRTHLREDSRSQSRCQP